MFSLKHNDRYKHWKGDFYYRTLGISNPLFGGNCFISDDMLKEIGVCIEESTLEPITLYDLVSLPDSPRLGLYFTKTEIPYVLYQHEGEEKIWARNPNDFFGHTQAPSQDWVKRFTLKSTNTN